MGSSTGIIKIRLAFIIQCRYNIGTMRVKRIRTKMFQVWLHPREYEFLTSYAEENMLTASETVRGWIHEVMRKEGYDIKEPALPESNKRKGVKK
jgi:hypothetical protein